MKTKNGPNFIGVGIKNSKQKYQFQTRMDIMLCYFYRDSYKLKTLKLFIKQ